MILVFKLSLYLFSPCLFIYLFFCSHDVIVDVIIIHWYYFKFSATFLNVGVMSNDFYRHI